ncbi:uncharacterized protein LOC125218455 [Salvia hispanica]|uniref:uncharacterized protein LOC125218455 n=1 Tax=Salvia hispanica TaxID=49212 RepID=UPI002009D551|nr:uncharacterized protein LOC125218455 [Salvia hispanica]
MPVYTVSLSQTSIPPAPLKVSTLNSQTLTRSPSCSADSAGPTSAPQRHHEVAVLLAISAGVHKLAAQFHHKLVAHLKAASSGWIHFQSCLQVMSFDKLTNEVARNEDDVALDFIIC